MEPSEPSRRLRRLLYASDVTLASKTADDLSVTTPTVSAMKNANRLANPSRQRRPSTSRSGDVVDSSPAPTSSDGLGAVFTRPWAVDLVLDLAGYTPDKDLAAGHVTEPSCGGGAFLIHIIDRLAQSCLKHGRDLAETDDAIRAWDLDPAAVAASRTAARQALSAHGVPPAQTANLADKWVREGDFLLQQCDPSDWIVGNPPYVRLEDVPTTRSAAYRARWSAMSGRADVYVGFIQAGLEALKPDGVLAFICADRWMRNQYGSRLRVVVENGFAVDAVVTLHDSDAFESRVAAYPAVIALRHGEQGPALIVDADATFGDVGASEVSADFAEGSTERPSTSGAGYLAAWTEAWFPNSPSWPTGKPDAIARVAALEKVHPAIGSHESGIRLGIGLASGADAIYLTKDTAAVEPERLLPLVMARDLRDGTVAWSGTHLINPWNDSALIDLHDYPRTDAYFTSHQKRLRARHVGQRQPDRWYRTIDRPIDGLADTPKLLVADLRHRVSPVLENQGLYPHHNLFWLTSNEWDLQALGGLLLSDYATLFVETYSPRMAGGALRVTAQYLRRICVPRWSSLSQPTRTALASAFELRDVVAATEAATLAYTEATPSPP